jgi:hypothetical protein
LGGIDHYDLHAAPEQIASHLSQIIDAVHQKGSAIILVKGSPGIEPALEATGKKPDLYAKWWDGIYIAPMVPRPEYDTGDGEHLNTAATDIVAARAVPDIERVLTALGLRPGSQARPR